MSDPGSVRTMIDPGSVLTDRRIGLLLLLFGAISCIGANALGVNYGTVANNLPTPADVVALVQSTYINKVKLYSADGGILTALANTGLQVVVGVTNDEIPSLAGSPSFAQQWVTTNVANFYPATNIIIISVGNEVLTTAPNMSSYLVPAIQNLHTGLTNLGLQDKIKVSTPHSFGVLTDSYPPSDGAFRTDLSGPVFVPLLAFLSQTGAPFMINAYPYFAYRDNPKLSISYALFEPNSGVVDSTTGLLYNNLFDAQVDATYAAMAKLGHQDVKVTVSETGWPSFGDSNEVGVSITNAQTYNGNLLKHVMANVGTPARPGVPIDTYIFSLFNENLKPGPTSERNFGLFLPDRETVYNVGLIMGSNPQPSPTPPAIETPPPTSPESPTPPAVESPPPTSAESPPPPAVESPAPTSAESPPPPAVESPPPTSAESPPPPAVESPAPTSSESPPPAAVESPPPSSAESPPPPYTAPPPPYPVPHVPPAGSITASPPPSAGTPPYFPSPSPPPSSPPSTPSPETSPPSPASPAEAPSSAPTPESPPSSPPPASSYPPPPVSAPPPPSFFNPPPNAGTPPPAATSPSPPVSASHPPAPESPPTPVSVPPGTPPAPPGTPSGPNTWCVAKPGALLSDLVTALNYACGEGGADCTAIQSGQPCFNPNTLFSHSSYAFNNYYAKNGRNYWNCFFGNSSLITITNPSYSGCDYP